MTCSGDNGDCPKPVEKAGLCAGHRWRKKNNLPINEPLRQYGDQWETLKAAMRAWLELDSDAAFERYEGESRGRSRAEARIARAAERWVASVKRRRAKSGGKQSPPTR